MGHDGRVDRLLVRLRSSGHAALRAGHGTSFELSDDDAVTTRATCVVGVGTAVERTDGREAIAGPVRIVLSCREHVHEVSAVANPYHVEGGGWVVRTGWNRLPDTIATESPVGAAGLPAALRSALVDPGATITTELYASPWRADGRRTVVLALFDPARPVPSDVAAWIGLGHPVSTDDATRRTVAALESVGPAIEAGGVHVLCASDPGQLAALVAELGDRLEGGDHPPPEGGWVVEWAGAMTGAAAVATVVAGGGPVIAAAPGPRGFDDARRRAGSEGTVAGRLPWARATTIVRDADPDRSLALLLEPGRPGARIWRPRPGSDGVPPGPGTARDAEVVVAVGPRDVGLRDAADRDRVPRVRHDDGVGVATDPHLVRELLAGGVAARLIVDVLSARPGMRRNEVQQWVRELAASGADRPDPPDGSRDARRGP